MSLVGLSCSRRLFALASVDVEWLFPMGCSSIDDNFYWRLAFDKLLVAVVTYFQNKRNSG